MSDETERPAEEPTPNLGADLGATHGGGGEPPSSTGMEANVAALLANLLGPITGLIFVLIEKDSRFVKFHAWQALFFGGGYIALQIVLMISNTVIPCIGGLIGMLLALVGFVIWIVLLIKAFQGQKFKLPVIGDLAEQQANK